MLFFIQVIWFIIGQAKSFGSLLARASGSSIPASKALLVCCCHQCVKAAGQQSLQLLTNSQDFV